ncbi:hypothetical protein BU15DRAFT_65718 [Melanogaster broomeanus]|nr:hypothetical protein BU15DRAFT_65718 [Melanogaster broomeanus]
MTIRGRAYNSSNTIWCRFCGREKERKNKFGEIEMTENVVCPELKTTTVFSELLNRKNHYSSGDGRSVELRLLATRDVSFSQIADKLKREVAHEEFLSGCFDVLQVCKVHVEQLSKDCLAFGPVTGCNPNFDILLCQTVVPHPCDLLPDPAVPTVTSTTLPDMSGMPLTVPAKDHGYIGKLIEGQGSEGEVLICDSKDHQRNMKRDVTIDHLRAPLQIWIVLCTAIVLKSIVIRMVTRRHASRDTCHCIYTSINGRAEIGDFDIGAFHTNARTLQNHSEEALMEQHRRL